MKNTNQKRLFCDSELVFNKLVKTGVITPDCSVFTRSFVVARNTEIKSIYLDEKLSMRERQDFKLGVSVTEKKLIKQLKNSPVSEPERLIFLQLFNSFQSDILDAILLGKDADFTGATVIAVPKTGNSQIDEVLRPNWINWISNRNNVSLIDVTVPYHNERAPRGEVKASISDRLKLGGKEAILWKIAQQRWFPVRSCKKGRIGVVGQTELARDAVASCLVNGFKPVFISKPKLEAGSVVPDFQMAEIIINECHSIIQDRFSVISVQFLRKRAAMFLLERLANEIGQYNFFKKEWAQQLALYSSLECIISGYSKGPLAMAMADRCRASGIKIAAFQHGITRELLANAKDRSIFFETSFCDSYFTMNEMSAEITKNCGTIKASKVIRKNWPSPFKRISQKLSSSGKSVLFVSTNLYSGHKPNGLASANDRLLCALEQGLVERVFGKANKTIDYKPYPAIRQLDADPVIAAVKAQPNMSVIGTHEDLRYKLASYEMFITSKASSTLSWIVATGKPLVFIDHFCDMRLSDEAREAFAEAFFLFDQSEEKFENILNGFLDQRIEDIQQQWKAKSLQRSEVIVRFFSGAQTNCCQTIFDDIRTNCMKLARNSSPSDS